jgi:hypothetical protein
VATRRSLGSLDSINGRSSALIIFENNGLFAQEPGPKRMEEKLTLVHDPIRRKPCETSAFC